MKIFAMVVGVILLATTAGATSNMERIVISDMQRAGLSEACISKLTTSDAARINGIMNNSKKSNGKKNREIKDAYRRICER